MNKIRLVLVAALFMIMATSLTFAEVPDNSIVLGDKAFSIELLFDADNITEINEALGEAAANGYGMYFRIGQDSFKDIFTMEEVTQSQISNWPQITYKDADGIKTVYDEGNGEEVSSDGGFSIADVY